MEDAAFTEQPPLASWPSGQLGKESEMAQVDFGNL